MAGHAARRGRRRRGSAAGRSAAALCTRGQPASQRAASCASRLRPPSWRLQPRTLHRTAACKATCGVHVHCHTHTEHHPTPTRHPQGGPREGVARGPDRARAQASKRERPVAHDRSARARAPCACTHARRRRRCQLPLAAGPGVAAGGGRQQRREREVGRPAGQVAGGGRLCFLSLSPRHRRQPTDHSWEPPSRAGHRAERVGKGGGGRGEGSAEVSGSLSARCPSAFGQQPKAVQRLLPAPCTGRDHVPGALRTMAALRAPGGARGERVSGAT